MVEIRKHHYEHCNRQSKMSDDLLHCKHAKGKPGCVDGITYTKSPINQRGCITQGTVKNTKLKSKKMPTICIHLCANEMTKIPVFQHKQHALLCCT